MKKVLFLFLGIFIISFVQAQDTTVVNNNDKGNKSVDSVKIKIGENDILFVKKQEELKEGLENLNEGLEDFQEKIDLKRQEIELWSDSIKIISINIDEDGDNDVYEIVIDSLETLIDMNEDIVEALTDGIENIKESIQELTDQLGDISGEKFEISDFDDESDFYYEDDNKKDKKRKKFKGHWSSMQIGLNSYTTVNYSLGLPAESDFMTVDLLQSKEFAINPFQVSIPFFNKYFGAVTGLGFTFNNYELIQNVQLTVDADGNLVSALDATTVYKKNRFKTTRLTVPLILELQIPVNKSDERILISGGVIGSYNLNSKMKYVYYYQNTKIKNKDKSSLWPVSIWSYAATARIGFDKTYLYVNYDLMPLFEAGKGPEIYPVSAGIGFSF